jgi:hypothetical protein
MEVELDSYVRNCVLKIISPGRRPEIVGTAFWVTARHCLTCLHNLGKNPHTHNIPIEYEQKTTSAFYCANLSCPEGDIAVLEVRGVEGKALPLGDARSDARARAFGYRRDSDSEYRVTGTLRPGQRFEERETYTTSKQ